MQEQVRIANYESYENACVEKACELIELGYEYVTEFRDQGIKICGAGDVI